MQGELIAIDAPAALRVGGLGVCDALRVELDAVQLPWLIDVLEEMRGPLEEQLQRARADHERDNDEDTARELNEREYELRLVRLMRSRLAIPSDASPVTFVGPSAMVFDVVVATMRNVTATLGELAEGRAGNGHERDDHLRLAAAAALAWVDTFVACRAVTSFNFDGDADPGRQW
jgi:hypothetical protein